MVYVKVKLPGQCVIVINKILNIVYVDTPAQLSVSLYTYLYMVKWGSGVTCARALRKPNFHGKTNTSREHNLTVIHFQRQDFFGNGVKALFCYYSPRPVNLSDHVAGSSISQNNQFSVILIGRSRSEHYRKEPSPIVNGDPDVTICQF